MLHNIFGELKFSIGWKAKKEVTLFGDKYQIVLKVQAYYEKDGINVEQENAYKKYIDSESDLLKTAEMLLIEKDAMAAERFKPKTLLVKRSGSVALLCDDEEEPDDGIAICFIPEILVMSQDEYL